MAMQEAKEHTAVPETTRSDQIPHIQDPDSDIESWERSSVSDDGDEDEDGARDGNELQNTIGAPSQNAYTEHQVPVAEGHHGVGGVTSGDEGPSKTSPAIPHDRDHQHTSEIASTPPPIVEETALHETNPFRRKMSLSNVHHRAIAPPAPAEAPPPFPPSADLAQLNINEPSTNPWQPVLNEQQPPLLPSLLPTEADQESGRNVWASQVPSRAPSTIPQPNVFSTGRLTPNGESESWGEQLVEPDKSPLAVPPSFRKPLEGEALDKDSHAWDDLATQDKGKAPATASPIAGLAEQSTKQDAWNLIDNEPTSGPAGKGDPSFPTATADAMGPNIPTHKESKTSVLPPRAPISTKEETYQVKNINWYDALGLKGIRQSPILVQNANGPCPLMALVNALTLTTPVSAEDAVLVNTLKTREQISLDLLLDAVFDELMSERRLSPDRALPDVTELYEFLKGLHTGMNVNPRFVPTEETEEAFRRTSLTHLHPSERENMIPGTFEDTQEMSFYRIFQIPLIHGWLPSKDEPAYIALKRHAESYEDAQNILFREEELEDKLNNLNSPGLSEEEQNIYQDVLSIKSFLQSAATQLTRWGLEVITKAMRPGSVAILFRNDHFSTLYRHPQTLQIFTLVTDAGYAGHQEVVWESLVDVNGERSGFFSGDFRSVGGEFESEIAGTSTSRGQGEWTTVQGKKGKGKTPGEEPPLSPKEQEDHDLALAMQLQEEEDQRHRSEQAQRRREAQLSEQFIEQQAVRRGPVGLRQGSISNGSRPAQPQQQQSPRGSPNLSNSPAAGRGRGGRAVPPQQTPTTPQQQQQRVRPLVPPVLRSQGVHRPTDEESDDAPPSYEDAAKDRPYHPPAGHPSHPNSSSNPPPPPIGIGGSSSTPRLLPSRVPGVAGIPRTTIPPGAMRRGSAYRQGMSPTTAASGGGRDKDCIVM